MKYVFGIAITLSLFVGHCYSASTQYIESESLEGLVYGFHNPHNNVKLAIGAYVSAKKLALQMICGEFASNLIELRGNHLYVDGKLEGASLSLLIAGGCPFSENTTIRQESYTYKPAIRFLVLHKYLGFWQKQIPDNTLQDEVQRYTSLEAVMEHVGKTGHPAVVVDFSAWLDVAFGADREHLPVIRVPRQYRWLGSDHTNIEPEELTQGQWEQRLANKKTEPVAAVFESVRD